MEARTKHTATLTSQPHLPLQRYAPSNWTSSVAFHTLSRAVHFSPYMCARRSPKDTSVHHLHLRRVSWFARNPVRVFPRSSECFPRIKKRRRRRPPALLLEEKENIHNKENTAFKLRNGKGRKEEKKSRKKTTKLVFTLFLSLGTHHHKHREYRVKQPTCCLSFFILSCLFVLSACMISDVWRGERKRMTGWRIK